MTEATPYRRFLATFGIFTLAAGDVWRYLFSWWGWGIIVVVFLTMAIIELVRARVDLRRLPYPLIAFLVLVTASIAWSAYPLGSVAGVALTLSATTYAVYLAVIVEYRTFVHSLGLAMRWILGASLLFELLVSTVVRDRVLPLWVDYSDLDRIPSAYYWSRDLLLEGGRIQGIVGNANLLALAALIGAITFAVQLTSRSASRPWVGFWLVIALLTVALTRSSTVLIAGAVAAAVGVFLLAVRRASGRARVAWYLGGIAVAAAGVIGAVAFRGPLLALLGRSPDLTNRLDIWQTVAGVAAQRPVFGWGWISYWAPWEPFFDDLVVIKGVTYLQAHDAWLDLYLQVGIVGLVVFGGLALATLVRSWVLALDVPATRALPAVPNRAALGFLPVLIVVALLVHSIAESRLLIEIGYVLLVVMAIRTRGGLASRSVAAETTPA